MTPALLSLRIILEMSVDLPTPGGPEISHMPDTLSEVLARA
jgi:hypothetical protein